MAQTTSELSTNIKGKHAELLVQTAFMANGYEVSEPISPQPYDLVVRRGNDDVRLVQVKTAFLRDEKRYGGKYVVVRGHKSNKDVYTRNEVDLFAAVWDGEVYIFPNREVSEYWCRPEELTKKWRKISLEI